MDDTAAVLPRVPEHVEKDDRYSQSARSNVCPVLKHPFSERKRATSHQQVKTWAITYDLSNLSFASSGYLHTTLIWPEIIDYFRLFWFYRFFVICSQWEFCAEARYIDFYRFFRYCSAISYHMSIGLYHRSRWPCVVGVVTGWLIVSSLGRRPNSVVFYRQNKTLGQFILDPCVRRASEPCINLLIIFYGDRSKPHAYPEWRLRTAATRSLTRASVVFIFTLLNTYV